MPQILGEINDEAFNPTEVVPGSVEDPFSANYNPASVPSKGVERVVAEDGLKINSAPEAPKAPAEETPTAAPLDDLLKDERLTALIDEKLKEVQEKSTNALRSQQSVYDKKIDALQKDLQSAREAARKADRDAKLSSDDLDDDEKEILRNKYALEDERLELDTYNQELNVYYRQLYVAQLSKDYEQYGVTPDTLEQFEEPEEMDAFVTKAELDWYRSGKAAAPVAQAVVPTRTVESTSNVPAGAQAPSDVGGNAPASRPREFSRETSRDAMVSNLFLLPEETVVFRPN